MRRFANTGRILAVVFISIAAIAALSLARAQDRQAVPREKQQESPPPERQRRPPDDEQRRAQPRPDAPRDDHDQRTAVRRPPPPRGITGPHHYAFSPVGARVRFYYHPYFGFYFGPYYGPYYPGAGPAFGRFNEGALRLRVRPVETEVYVNGYYAGVVDDFDGVFQRLYLPRGEHQITLRLPGYQSHTVGLHVRSGAATDVFHDMRRLPAGTPDSPPPPPRPLPRDWTEPPTAGQEPVCAYGILALRTAPSDAQILVDGEAWGARGRAIGVRHSPRRGLASDRGSP